MRFNFRKIASAAASIAMMGSTIGLAAAANYPAPFVTGGAGDVAFVYGSVAASTDLVAVINIQDSLSALITASGDTGPSITGEAYALFSSGDNKIYLNDSINVQRDTITDTELPTVLADSDFEGDVSADLTHTIKIGVTPRLVYTKQPTSEDDPNFNIELATAATSATYNATVDFDKAVNFTLADSEGEEITLFGQTFTVGAATDATNLVLFKSAETVFLQVGGDNPNPSQQVTVDDETYTVELVSASDTEATIRLTDSAGNSDQKEINEAASKKILGIEVSVNSADESVATSTISAEVVVGADKIKMSDLNEVLIGADEDAVDGTKTTFTGGVGAMTQLILEVAAQDSDEDAILPGGSFVDPVFGNFKIDFVTLTNDDDRGTIKVRNSGDDKMTLTMTDRRGNEKLSLNWVYNATTILDDVLATAGIPVLGDSSGDLIKVNEMTRVNRTQYIVIGNEDEGRLIEVKTITNASGGFDNDKVTLQDVFTGENHDVSITAEGTGSVSIGGNSYIVTYFASPNTIDSNARSIRIQDPDSGTNNMNMFNTMETSKGAKVALYEPIQINLGSWDGSSTDIAGLRFPDGDGYTGISIVKGNDTDGIWNVTVGTTVHQFNTKAATPLDTLTPNVTFSIGQLKYNMTFASADTNLTNIFLQQPGGADINFPALIIFEEQDDNDKYEVMVVRLDGVGTDADGLGVAGNGVDRTSWSSSGYGYPLSTSYTTHETDTDFSSATTLWGSIITLDSSESDQKTVEISYPDQQIHAEVYISEEAAVVTGDGGVSGGVLGSVTVMDSEVSQVSGKNLIVIGGSCVNTVAASLLGSDTPMCGAAWTAATGAGAGQYLVQTFDGLTSGKIATLVAGTEASDTTNAATYFRTQSPLTDVGSKYVGSTAASAELQTEETTE